MEVLVNLTSRVLNSSSGSTAEWNSTYTKTKNAISKVLKKFGATDIKFNKGHFSMSGFFTYNGKYFYISLSDFRSPINEMLIRTAKSYKDYTGGSNYYINIARFEEKLEFYLSNI